VRAAQVVAVVEQWFGVAIRATTRVPQPLIRIHIIPTYRDVIAAKLDLAYARPAL
jgi:hypothetical protein